MHLLQRNAKIGKKLSEIVIGEKLDITETIEDKDLLLYLGLTNDNNPLYIQHDYAATTPYEKPIVPMIMLNGIIASAISKYMPGPGSRITEQSIKFLLPVYHYETISFSFQVAAIDEENNSVQINVQAFNANDEAIIDGSLKVTPPY